MEQDYINLYSSPANKQMWCHEGIDIESDPRAEELKEIFEDWQDQVSGDMSEEEEQYPGE